MNNKSKIWRAAPRLLSTRLPLALAILSGCAPMASVGSGVEAPAISGDNGLKTINGLKAHNGLDVGGNGLSLASGLSTLSGLSSTSGLMTTADGRTTVSYLVRCALPTGHSITKTDAAGNRYTFTGSMGLAPEWETAACGQTCQGWISACMLSLVNTTGDHYPVWMDGQATALGWGTDPAYPYQEGSFFGNIFTTNASAYYCRGRDFGVKPIPGRIGSAQTGAPYTDAFAGVGTCASNCTAADIPHQGDGSKACAGFNQVVTIWHQ
jgi:hypothetical protein